MFLLSSAREFQHRLARRRESGTTRAKKIRHFLVEIGKFGTRGHGRSVPAKKMRIQVCSEQDDKRFRFRLGRPRAAAHGWGSLARILTEINRLPQYALDFPRKNPGRVQVPHGLSRTWAGQFCFSPDPSLDLLDAK
jgi:hypothetical protein